MELRKGSKRALLSFAVVAVVAAVALWLGRDLPRQRLEAALAQRLGAEVRVGAFKIQRVDRFRIGDLTVRRMRAEPRLAELRVDALEVRGGLADVLDASFDLLHLRGAELILHPPQEAAVPAAAPLDVRVRRLIVDSARLVVRGAEEELRAAVVADLRDLGTNPTGEIRLQAGAAPLAPLLAVLDSQNSVTVRPDGQAEDLQAIVEALGGGGWALRARARALEGEAGEFGGALEQVSLSATLRDDDRQRRLEWQAEAVTARLALSGSELETVQPRLAGTGTLADDHGFAIDFDLETGDSRVRRDAHVLPLTRPSARGRLEREAASNETGFEIEVQLSGVESLRARGAIAAASSSLVRVEASLDGLDLASWSPVMPFADGWDVQGRLDAQARGSLETGFELSARADVKRLATVVEGAPLDAQDTTLSLRARIPPTAAAPWTVDGRFDCRGATVDYRGVELPRGLFPVNGSLSGALDPSGAVRFSGRLALKTPVGELHVEGLPPLRREDRMDLDWRWTGTRLAVLRRLAADSGFTLPEAVVLDNGYVTATGTLDGTAAALEVAGLLAVHDLEAHAASEQWRLVRGRASLEMRWSEGGPVSWALQEAGGRLAVESQNEVPVAVDAQGTLDFGTGEIDLARARLIAGDLATLHGRGSWQPGRGPPGALEIELTAASLPHWLEWLGPTLGDGASGYEVKGRAEAEIRIAFDERSWNAGGVARIVDSGVSSADGTRVAEGLETAWRLEAGSGDPAGAPWGKATADVGGFLLLWGSLFADLSEVEGNLAVEVQGKPTSSGREWQAAARLVVPQGPRVELRAALREDPPVDYSLELAVDDLRTTFERYLRHPFEGSVPAIERLQAAGRARLAIDGVLDARSGTAVGRLGLHELQLGGLEEQVAVAGLELELPIELTWRPVDDGGLGWSGPQREGTLRFDRLKFGGIAFGETATGLSVRADSIAFSEGLAVPFLGGVLGFEELILAELLRPSRHLQTAMLLWDVDLRRLSDALGLPPLEGEMEGYFPSVRLSRDLFRTEGASEFRLFGGRVTVGDITGRDLLSRYPRLELSARFDDIDLGQVTQTFDFGKVTGIVQGRLEDCELFSGVPVRFRGQIETVRRAGVPRSLNVKAVNNISILGTGGASGVLNKGLYKLFDRFTYEAIGVSMVLQQDRFLLRGLERRGDRELFVKGRLPFRIDVVNAQPGQTVSFRNMMQRLRNLDFQIR